MERRIAKVRYRGGKVEVVEREEEGDLGAEKSREILTKCDEEPAQAFVDALRRLAPHVRTILELPEDYARDRIEIIGASWGRTKDGVDGATISGYVKLTKTTAPFVFNTPYLHYDLTSDNPTQPVMPDEAQADLVMLRVAVQAYLDGDRAQGDLFDPGKAAMGEDRELREQVTDIAHSHGIVSKGIIDDVVEEMGGGPPEPDFASRGDDIEALTPAGKTLARAAVVKGVAEETGNPNVIRMKGRKRSGKDGKEDGPHAA